MDKRADVRILVFVFLIVGILVAGFVLAYPVLDSGITDTAQEDTLYSYNFTQNVTFVSGDEPLVFSIEEINSTNSLHSDLDVADFDWISINSSTGNMTINSTNSNSTDDETGNFTISVHVVNQVPEGTTVSSYFNVTPVNDAPVFVGLENQSFNVSELFEYNFSVTDEENNVPFNFTINFTSCSLAEWSDRGSNCTLFDDSDYDFNETTGVLNISFARARNDVGVYTINFSVTDNSTISPGNQTTSQLVNFSVLNVNQAPYFRYVCDNERNATEDSEFTCWINVSDIDETNNLTLTFNYSWFTFNGSTLSSSKVVDCNVTSEYNVSAMVNFTANDSMVGNWSVNFSVLDTGSPDLVNSTVFWFFINNTEDNVSLAVIENQTSENALAVYENKTIYVNATDEDLLVPDESVKDEVLSFDSNTSWVNISSYYSSANYTTAKIEIDWDAVYNGDDAGNHTGNYTVNVNVTDVLGDYYAERNFTIEILGDTMATWNQTNYTFVVYEGNKTYLNLSEYVNDSEGDSLTFSFVNDANFVSFNSTTFKSTGIINFTAVDADVGQHLVTVNANDGKLDSLEVFNFTIYNVNDDPSIQTPLTADNVTVDANSNMNTSEDNYATIILSIVDNDVKIPSTQISNGFYNESLNINLTIQGANNSLFNFSFQSVISASGLWIYEASFIPGKLDIGDYNVTINVTDNSGSSDVLEFNITISEKSHNPVLVSLVNQTSAVNRFLYYDINATDTEDGNDLTGNLTYNLTFLADGKTDYLFNSTTFNSTTGEINITFNNSQGGLYHINISVNDSTGDEMSEDFWLFVYDIPSVIYPPTSYNFSLQENTTSYLNFSVNHSVGDNLTYLFYIDGVLRENTSYYGNSTNLTWEFVPNFTDETYGVYENLTLVVYSANSELENASDLNTTINWNVNISHVNYPLSWLGTNQIGGIGRAISGGSPQIVTLSDYFSDIDASDVGRNNTVKFATDSWGASGQVISVSVVNWVRGSTPSITFLSLKAGSCNYKITASEYNESNSSQVLRTVMSNNFSVELTVTETLVPTSGGRSSTKPVSLKIIMPSPISVYGKKRIVVPITLMNTGKGVLSGINLSSIVAKNGFVKDDVFISFNKSYFSSLRVGEKQDVTLVIDVDTENAGLYEITVNATVKNPKYSDWGKFFLTVEETSYELKMKVLEKFVFTEEFIAENPECIELKEIINEAREFFDEGDYVLALEKSEQAIDACKYAISQQALPRVVEKLEDKFYRYLTVFSIAMFALGISYYSYKKIKLRRMVLN